LAPSSGSWQGDYCDVVPIASMSGSAWDCDMGYVAFLKATYPLSPSGLMDGDMVPGARAPFPLPPFFFPFFLSRPLRALWGGRGAFSVVVVAVLRWASLRSCRGRVRAVRCEEETAKPTRRPQRVSLPSSGRARVGRRRRGDACCSPSGSPRSVGGDRENRVLGVGRGSGSRVVTIGIRAWSDRTCSRSKLQQRSQARQLVKQHDESDMPAQGQVQEEVSVEESVAQPQGVQAAAAAAAAAGRQQQQEYHP
ncbi:hypothetical protein Taro_027643, partial [Colocasia esculenta]|nr:hypothetical protein [Colocasia esculenta]